MLQLNLKRIFKARGIEQPYKFLAQNGFVPFTAHKYKNGKVEHMRLDHIEKLCTVLNCTPNDIFEIEITKLLSKMSLEKLEEIEKLIEANH